MATLTLTLADAQALRVLFEEQLSKGRAFVPRGAGVAARQACELVLDQGGRQHRLAAEVVHVREEEPGPGVGLQLARLDTNAASELRAFVEASVEVPQTEPPATDTDPEREGDPGSQRALHLHERIQSLSGLEQQKLASSGTLQERIAVERMYGSTVWETLLRNSRVTPPEAARIARKATVPRPLIELVAANATWVATGEVQRALLSNPRSSSAVINKVLRVMSRSDLQLVPQQTAYPVSVRQAAKAILGK